MSFLCAKANDDSYVCPLYNNIFAFHVLPKRLKKYICIYCNLTQARRSGEELIPAEHLTPWEGEVNGLSIHGSTKGEGQGY